MKTKIEKIRVLLDSLMLEGIVIENQANFGWLTGGRGFIGLASETACASVLITKNDAFLISSNIESQRLLDEEIPDGLILYEYLWTDEQEKKRFIDAKCGSNFKTDRELSGEFFELRTVLDNNQIKQYREIAPKIAGVLEEKMAGLAPGTSELELAGRLSEGLWAMDVEPVTILTAFDERISRWRHPLPTGNKLEKQALGAVAVRYKGLFISATRQICIGCLPKDISQKHEAVTEIDSRLIERTREGISMEEMFQLAKDSYKDVGYEDEWKNHHQGGLSGFLSRESKAMPGNTVKVRGNQAFAWNPTIRGTKSEDTMLLFNGEQSILTETGKWQYTTKSGIRRPVIISI